MRALSSLAGEPLTFVEFTHRSYMPTARAYNCRERKTSCSFDSCIPVANLMQLRAANGARGTYTPALHFGFSGLPESTTQKGTYMKCASVVKVAAVAVVVGLAGCTDLKPVQADIADLKSQVAKLQSDVQASKSSSDQAASAAQSAQQAASGAQSTANQALAAAQAAQSAVDATNEKIDRMFKRSISK
jgi:hypothetical protein